MAKIPSSINTVTDSEGDKWNRLGDKWSYGGRESYLLSEEELERQYGPIGMFLTIEEYERLTSH